jgi:hypothetical protein
MRDHTACHPAMLIIYTELVRARSDLTPIPNRFGCHALDR